MLLICCNSKFNFGPQCDSQVGFVVGGRKGAKSMIVVSFVLDDALIS